MLNSMSNGVITVDGDGIVEKCNPAGLKILKIESEEKSELNLGFSPFLLKFRSLFLYLPLL